MNHAFKNLGEALDAGYTPSSEDDRDVSGSAPGGGQYYGYDYESLDEQRTVSVWFTEEENRMGSMGCFRAMYPPKPARS